MGRMPHRPGLELPGSPPGAANGKPRECGPPPEKGQISNNRKDSSRLRSPEPAGLPHRSAGHGASSAMRGLVSGVILAHPPPLALWLATEVTLHPLRGKAPPRAGPEE
eukprot:scaffold2529_cov363-Prasinococcus_capsulatus_cf.AAC.23